MSLFKSIAWRLLAGIGVLWGAATLTFLAVNFSGGDTALAILGGPMATWASPIACASRCSRRLPSRSVQPFNCP